MLNVTLSGLEEAVKAATKKSDKVNVVIYADDFVITGATHDVLENKVKPIVEKFLRERGLTLSQEKTKITHINEGFDFLGFNVRKYRGKLIIKPAKSNVKQFLADIREMIKRNSTERVGNLIARLNPRIYGWSNYYRHVCSKATFSYVDNQLFKATWQWAVRQHPNKSKKWVKQKYYRRVKSRNWVFFAKVKDNDKGKSYVNLENASDTPIKRHVKIRMDANPYDPLYRSYCERRIAKHRMTKDNDACNRESQTLSNKQMDVGS